MIHPDIRAFWVNRGYQVQCHSQSAFGQTHPNNVWVAKIPGQHSSKRIARETSFIAYYLDGKQYSEDDMLRMIKLGTFL